MWRSLALVWLFVACVGAILLLLKTQGAWPQSISMWFFVPVAAVIVAPAQAQDAGSALLDEIVVTAQKREQNLQDVAVSIQVLGNEELENLDVRNFEDFINFLPTVQFASGGSGFGPGFGSNLSLY